jgi:hypothetical protein
MAFMSAGIFPHLVIRIGGLPWDDLGRLVANESWRVANEILANRRALQADAAALSASIHDLVPGRPRSERRKLLRLRRDVFNLRDPRAGDVEVVPASGAGDRLAAFQASLEDHRARTEEFRRIFEAEDGTALRQLLDVCRDPDFRAGLRLSSRSLSRVLDGLLGADGHRIEAKAERGLLRYMTRAAGKATPFGRFCSIVHGELEPVEVPLTLTADPAVKWSRVRVNKRIMQAVLHRLTTDDESRKLLPLRLNPTLRTVDGGISFLASFRSREAFQLVASNPAVELLVASLAERNGGTIHSLAVDIASLPEVDATETEAEEYLDNFLDIGLLQPDLAGLGHDPEWPETLADIVSGMGDVKATRESKAFLDRLRSHLDALRSDDPDTIDPVAFDRLREFVDENLGDWFEDGFRVAGPRVYEDAGTRGVLRVDERHFGGSLERLTCLLGHLVPAVWSRRETFSMRAFHERRFGDTRVSLQEFYETYYREEVKQGEDDEGDTPRDPASTSDGGEQASEPAGAAAIRVAHTGLSTILRERWQATPAAREIVLTEQDVRSATSGVPPLPAGRRSLSAFVNLVPRPGHRDGGMVVLPNARTYAGYGKYFSRFLYLLPEEVLDDLRSEARDLAEAGGVTAEIAGDAAFNANLRPSIQPCEIAYPTGDRIGCPEALDVGELEVGPSDCGSRLDVFHRPTGRRVRPLDLGFLNPRARPPLYRLLRSLGPTAAAFMNVPSDHGPRGPAEQDSGTPGRPPVRRRPRITFEGSVVLARQSWWVKPEALPASVPGEGHADLFMRMAEWRERAGLPVQAYVRARRRRGSRVSFRDDLRRPQLIDFRSPPLVRLLEQYRELGDAALLVFEECLPTEAELPTDEQGRRWVAEAVLQLTLVTGAESPAGSRRASVREVVVHA